MPLSGSGTQGRALGVSPSCGDSRLRWSRTPGSVSHGCIHASPVSQVRVQLFFPVCESSGLESAAFPFQLRVQESMGLRPGVGPAHCLACLILGFSSPSQENILSPDCFSSLFPVPGTLLTCGLDLSSPSGAFSRVCSVLRLWATCPGPFSASLGYPGLHSALLHVGLLLLVGAGRLFLGGLPRSADVSHSWGLGQGGSLVSFLAHIRGNSNTPKTPTGITFFSPPSIPCDVVWSVGVQSRRPRRNS